jgi:ketosteroid isomerase-like protein
MATGNADIVRAIWADFEQHPYDIGDGALYHADLVYESDALPDQAGETYHGFEEMRRAWATASAPWEDLEVGLEWVREIGADVAVSSHFVRGRGVSSGLPMEAKFGYVWRFRDGKAVYLRAYGSAGQALRAVGAEA